MGMNLISDVQTPTPGAAAPHPIVSYGRAVPLLTILTSATTRSNSRHAGKALVPDTRQLVVPNGHHFPMCDNPGLAATSIRTWYRDVVTV